MTVPMVPVSSSNIKAVGYDPATQALHVAFHNGTTGIHDFVPPEKHGALMAAQSVGSHYHKNFRGNTDHPYRKHQPEASPQG